MIERVSSSHVSEYLSLHEDFHCAKTQHIESQRRQTISVHCYVHFFALASCYILLAQRSTKLEVCGAIKSLAKHTPASTTSIIGCTPHPGEGIPEKLSITVGGSRRLDRMKCWSTAYISEGMRVV
jgi:hypothetical protein